MSQLMICPDTKCPDRIGSNCQHAKPHKKGWQCQETLSCRKCVPYKPARKVTSREAFEKWLPGAYERKELKGLRSNNTAWVIWQAAVRWANKQRRRGR